MPPKPRNGKSWRPDRARGVGDRHPPGTLLHVAPRLAAAVPHRGRAAGQLRGDLPAAAPSGWARRRRTRCTHPPDRRGRGQRRGDHPRLQAVRPHRAQAADLPRLCGSGRSGRGSSRSRRRSRWRWSGRRCSGPRTGTFLAVDWALMTDIIPRASAGPVHGHEQRGHGRVDADLDRARRARAGLCRRRRQRAVQPAAVFLLAVVVFVAAAVTLRPVIEPRRAGGAPAPAAAAA